MFVTVSMAQTIVRNITTTVKINRSKIFKHVSTMGKTNKGIKYLIGAGRGSPVTEGKFK